MLLITTLMIKKREERIILIEELHKTLNNCRTLLGYSIDSNEDLERDMSLHRVKEYEQQIEAIKGEKSKREQIVNLLRAEIIDLWFELGINTDRKNIDNFDECIMDGTTLLTD